MCNVTNERQKHVIGGTKSLAIYHNVTGETVSSGCVVQQQQQQWEWEEAGLVQWSVRSLFASHNNLIYFL